MSLQGEFALEWHIYGLDYGVPIIIDDWMKQGFIFRHFNYERLLLLHDG